MKMNDELNKKEDNMFTDKEKTDGAGKPAKSDVGESKENMAFNQWWNFKDSDGFCINQPLCILSDISKTAWEAGIKNTRLQVDSTEELFELIYNILNDKKIGDSDDKIKLAAIITDSIYTFLNGKKDNAENNNTKENKLGIVRTQDIIKNMK